MRWALAAKVLVLAAPAKAAEDAPRAWGMVGVKKVRFPDEGVASGVKAVMALLESGCRRNGQLALEL